MTHASLERWKCDRCGCEDEKASVVYLKVELPPLGWESISRSSVVEVLPVFRTDATVRGHVQGATPPPSHRRIDLHFCRACSDAFDEFINGTDEETDDGA